MTVYGTLCFMFLCGYRPALSVAGACIYLQILLQVWRFGIFEIISVVTGGLHFASFQRNLKCCFISFFVRCLYTTDWPGMYFAPIHVLHLLLTFWNETCLSCLFNIIHFAFTVECLWLRKLFIFSWVVESSDNSCSSYEGNSINR